jgi:hypothetical protein
MAIYISTPIRIRKYMATQAEYLKIRIKMQIFIHHVFNSAAGELAQIYPTTLKVLFQNLMCSPLKVSMLPLPENKATVPYRVPYLVLVVCSRPIYLFDLLIFSDFYNRFDKVPQE